MISPASLRKEHTKILSLYSLTHIDTYTHTQTVALCGGLTKVVAAPSTRQTPEKRLSLVVPQYLEISFQKMSVSGCQSNTHVHTLTQMCTHTLIDTFSLI